MTCHTYVCVFMFLETVFDSKGQMLIYPIFNVFNNGKYNSITFICLKNSRLV